MIAGDYRQAAALYGELVRALPANPDLRMSLGVALESSGRYREAIAAFREVLKAKPEFAPALVFTGAAYGKLGEPAIAIPPLERALRLEPSNAIALLELGDAYLQTSRIRQAVDIFERLTAIQPGAPKAWQGLGLSYNALSLEAFEKLEKAAPESSYFYALAARSKLDRQQYAAAFALYKKALAAEPRGLPEIHAGVAEVYRRTGHDDWAQIEAGLEKQPREPMTPAVPGSAAAYYDESRAGAAKAVDAFTRLSRLPETPELHGLLAQAARIQGHYMQAEEQYRSALRLDPANRKLQLELAQTLWLAHDFDTALPALEALLRADPSSAEVNFEIGDIRLEKNEAVKAVPHLTAALRAKPGFTAAHADLGKTYLQLGRPREAIPHLKAALSADADGTAHYQLARAYRESAQPQLAKQAMAEFEKLYRSRQARRAGMETAESITAPGN